MTNLETVASVLGLILSCYALYVEYKNEHKDPDEEFTSLCDIEAIGASCSAVFQHPVGRMCSYFGLVPKDSFLDVPNAALGVVYYTFRIFLADTTTTTISPSWLTQLLTLASFASSVFLAYQLTFVLHDLCVLCWSIHVVNSFLTYRMLCSVYMANQGKTESKQS